MDIFGSQFNSTNINAGIDFTNTNYGGFGYIADKVCIKARFSLFLSYIHCFIHIFVNCHLMQRLLLSNEFQLTFGKWHSISHTFILFLHPTVILIHSFIISFIYLFLHAFIISCFLWINFLHGSWPNFFVYLFNNVVPDNFSVYASKYFILVSPQTIQVNLYKHELLLLLLLFLLLFLWCKIYIWTLHKRLL